VVKVENGAKPPLAKKAFLGIKKDRIKALFSLVLTTTQYG